jgi:hypothetical protein
MPLSVSRMASGPAQGSVAEQINPLVPTQTGINVGGSVQVTGVILAVVLLLAIAIAKHMGGIG